MLVIGNRTLGTALEDKARRLADAPFLIFEDASGAPGGRWSWQEFDRDVASTDV